MNATLPQLSRSRDLVVLLAISTLATSTSCTRLAPDHACTTSRFVDALAGCASKERAPYALPFRQRHLTRITQGFHGSRTHGIQMPFALDFACEEGEPIVAARGGRVWEKREDSFTECADPSCDTEANYVIIDHGDGTFAGYHHLTPFGVVVEEGDSVCRGEVIGICGKSGYTVGPHLHFEVIDSTQRTIPPRFVEAMGSNSQGFVVPRTTYMSRNEREIGCETSSYSTLGPLAFIHQGITLDHALERVYSSGDSPFVLSGTYRGGLTHVAIHRKSAARRDDPWHTVCMPLTQERRFRVELDWSQPGFVPGRQWLMITGADASCHTPGWAWSYWIQWRPPEGVRPLHTPSMRENTGRESLRLP